jgi:hypothetical protein
MMEIEASSPLVMGDVACKEIAYQEQGSIVVANRSLGCSANPRRAKLTKKKASRGLERLYCQYEYRPYHSPYFRRSE